MIAAVAASAALIGGGVYASRIYGGSAVPEMGTLNVQSSPAGVEVFVDGVSRGMTPAQVSVAAGSHILELRGRGASGDSAPGAGRRPDFAVLEFADTPTTGMLVVHSQPQGANVTVDGTPRRGADHDRRAVERRSRSHASEPRGHFTAHREGACGTTASLVAPVVAGPHAGERTGVRMGQREGAVRDRDS